MKERFEIYGFNNNKDASEDDNTISRFRNNIVGAMRDQPILPKFMVIVPDDDIIKFIKKREPEAANEVGFARAIKWLLCQIDRLIMTQKDFLPTKCKRPGEPTVVFIQPPIHDKFKNNGMRIAFNNALSKEVTYHDNVYALEMKKMWDPSDSSLYNRTDCKYTAKGYSSYWDAVDKTVRFADTLLLKKEERKNNRNQKSTSGPNQKLTVTTNVITVIIITIMIVITGHQDHEKVHIKDNHLMPETSVILKHTKLICNRTLLCNLLI